LGAKLDCPAAQLELSYQAIDLNDEDWPALREWLDAKRSSKVLVMPRKPKWYQLATANTRVKASSRRRVANERQEMPP
jgi:hypothetical protein